MRHVTHDKYPSISFWLCGIGAGTIYQLFTAVISHESAAHSMKLMKEDLRYLRSFEMVLIYLILTIFVIEYVIFAHSVIIQFCEHLKIKCLTIPTKNTRSESPTLKRAIKSNPADSNSTDSPRLRIRKQMNYAEVDS